MACLLGKHRVYRNGLIRSSGICLHENQTGCPDLKCVAGLCLRELPAGKGSVYYGANAEGSASSGTRSTFIVLRTENITRTRHGRSDVTVNKHMRYCE